MKISLIIPSRNNLKYLEWAYDSIRKNQGTHEVQICVADDASTDGTWDWCNKKMKEDPDFDAILNWSDERLGLVVLNDKLINEVAKHDLCMIYHADMYLCPGALDAVEKYMYSVDTFSRKELEQDKLEEYERETGEKIDKLNVKVRNPKTIVSLTRIEPPLHPPGPEKLLEDFGIEPEEFDEERLLEYVEYGLYQPQRRAETTEGIFAPWAFWKKDFQEIGGHDPIFAPQSKEDSDIFNRFHLNGIKFVQTWEGFVYHMTSRGSRFNPASGGAPGKDSPEWLHTTTKNTRNFIRKWGQMIKHDPYMKPIVHPKYNIGIRLENGNLQLLEALEPWCDRIYTEQRFSVIGTSSDYIEMEQANTDYDLRKRVHSLTGNDKFDYDDIIVEIDGRNFGDGDYHHIIHLSEILSSDDQLEPGQFELGNLKITIIELNTYEKENIICKK